MSSSFLHLVFIFSIFPFCSSVCPDQRFPVNPADPTVRGSFSVGVVAVSPLESTRNFSLRVFYPTTNVSGSPPVSFDMLNEVPPDIAAKLVGRLPPQECDGCFFEPHVSNLGPFPLMVFVHGTGGWSAQSLHFLLHWASRGFIVASANYPGICLYDFLLLSELKPAPAIDQEGDTRLILAAFETLDNPQLKRFQGLVDMTRVALSGHSAGAAALQNMDDVADVLFPMAGYGVKNKRRARSVIIFSGAEDTIMAPVNQAVGYATTPVVPRGLLVVNNTGHQGFSELCTYAADQGGIIGIAESVGMWQAYAFKPLATQGCNFDGGNFLPAEETWTAVDYATSAAMESLLMCDDRMDAVLSNIAQELGGNIVQKFEQVLEEEYAAE